jgi:hypothetical protein
MHCPKSRYCVNLRSGRICPPKSFTSRADRWTASCRGHSRRRERRCPNRRTGCHHFSEQPCLLLLLSSDTPISAHPTEMHAKASRFPRPENVLLAHAGFVPRRSTAYGGAALLKPAWRPYSMLPKRPSTPYTTLLVMPDCEISTLLIKSL